MLVIEAQPGQFCRVTVPEAESVTLTLPLEACRVRAPALTVPEMSPLLDTRTAVAAEMPEPEVDMLELPEVESVVLRKKVFLTEEGLTVTVVPTLYGSEMKDDPLLAVIARTGALTLRGEVQLKPMPVEPSAERLA